MDALAVGTDPGWPVTHSPQVFLKTGFADHKSAGTTQTVGFLFFAAMTLIFADLSFPVARIFTLFFVHLRNSFSSHWWYSSLR